MVSTLIATELTGDESSDRPFARRAGSAISFIADAVDEQRIDRSAQSSRSTWKWDSLSSHCGNSVGNDEDLKNE